MNEDSPRVSLKRLKHPGFAPVPDSLKFKGDGTRTLVRSFPKIKGKKAVKQAKRFRREERIKNESKQS